MFRTKKHRHKPLYKQFIRLKKNVQNRRILRVKRNKPFTNRPNYTYNTLIVKFKKRKWKGFVSYLEKTLKYRKRSFKMYNIKLYHIQKFPDYLKKKYSNKIQAKKSLSLFYGGLLKKYLKNQCRALKPSFTFMVTTAEEMILPDLIVSIPIIWGLPRSA